MATTERSPTDAPDGTAVASALREAGFVHVLAHADADALAAAGLLARAVEALGTPSQLSVVRTAAAAGDRIADADETTTTVAVGLDGPGTNATDAADAAVSADPAPASVTAFDAAAALGATPDPALALAGVLQAGGVPGRDDHGRIADALADRGAIRRPGLALPSAGVDRADGLAHSTLVHGPWSGDPDAAGATVRSVEDGSGNEDATDDATDDAADDASGDAADDASGDAADDASGDAIDDATRRALASLVALDVTEDAPDRAAVAVERALRPFVLDADDPAPFPTVGGYADVLEALARSDPGLGAALALGRCDREAALAAWRRHAVAVHDSVHGADPARVGDLAVVHTDGPVWTTARLVRDFRSTAPAVLTVGDGELALATATTAADARTALDAALDDDVGGRRRLAYAATASTPEPEAGTVSDDDPIGGIVDRLDDCLDDGIGGHHDDRPAANGGRA